MRFKIFFRLTCMFLVLAISSLPLHAQVYVAANGSDLNDGSQKSPYASLHMALRHVRELRRLNDPATGQPIRIILARGIYSLQEAVFIRPEDSGTEASPTIIEGDGDNAVIISGGLQVKGWKKVNSEIPGISKTMAGKLWVVDEPKVGGNFLDFRQLWVNEKKGVRARTPRTGSMYRILDWNRQTGDCWIPASGLSGVTDPDGVEMVVHQWWAIANLRVKALLRQGDSVRLSFHEPENRIQKEHPWPAPWMSKETGNSAYYLTNALSFLDEPGEWYLDKGKHKLYYWPRANENLMTAAVVVPVLETLVRIRGTADNPVSNVYFKNISFQYSTWLRPSNAGNVPHQAGMYMLDAYKLKKPGTPGKKSLENQAWIGRPGAAIEINYTDKTIFENCRFEHTAATALDYNKGVHDNLIKGNLFKDIGGTAILAGLFADEATEIHLPYHPKDERDVCSGMMISNNLITDATNEDWGCVGIGAGYVRNTNIDHNEIADVGYSGVSMGWGWTPAENVMRDNKITANYIHHYGKHNYDCAGIYTLSAQPGTVISENVVDSIYKAPYAHLPSHWFYLYTDEGSSGITVKDNWTPSQKYLQNANGPGNQWINNGPQVDAAIRQDAGLQKGYEYLAVFKSKELRAIPVNTEHKELIELVTKDNNTIDIKQLRAFLGANQLDPEAVYQWQNHYVVFDKMKDIGALQHKLQQQFPGAEVKPYYDLFYKFDRGRCGDTTTAKEWDNVILTANLVADPKKQQEYLAYHRTQFEKWPEVAKGFCNADFQQLLVFRNGRQLMLVISIPKGESLDELNPKTTENNPRVDEWNKIMKQYQEGIGGTKKGETWVFLKQL